MLVLQLFYPLFYLTGGAGVEGLGLDLGIAGGRIEMVYIVCMVVVLHGIKQLLGL